MKRWLMSLSLLTLALMLPVVAFGTGEETFGREALSTLENGETMVDVYDAICEALEENTTDDGVDVQLYSQGYRLTFLELQTVIQVITQDRPELFWLDNGYSYGLRSDGYVSRVIVYVTMVGQTRETAKQAVERAAWELLAGIRTDMTEAEKALYIHDRLADHVTYASNTNGAYVHTLYGALGQGIAVCDGYAEAYQYLLRKVGIESYVATGTGNDGDHAWNYVRIDGKYYQTDVTWDDQGAELYHAYYNLTDAGMLEDHALDDVPYSLPVCNSTDAFYFQGDAYLDTYTVESVGKLLADNRLYVHVYVPGDFGAFYTWFQNNHYSILSSANAWDAMSYGMKCQGKEIVIYFATNAVALVKTADGGETRYTSLQTAVDACEVGSTLILLQSTQGDITLKGDLTLDLNGYCLTGRIQTNGYSIFGMDSATDDYQGTGAGSFCCTDAAGNGVIPEPRTEASGERHYLAVNTDGAYSFHRFDLALTRVRVRPDEDAISFWLVMRADAAMRNSLHSQKALTLAIRLDNGKTLQVYKGSDGLVSGKPVILNISDYDVDEHGQSQLQIDYSLVGADGSAIYTHTYETSAREIFEKLNTRSFSGGILALLRAFIEKHLVIRQWNTENLWK